MKFFVKIKTDNAAFGNCEHERNAEIARILKVIVQNLESDITNGTAEDINGHTVAEYGHGFRQSNRH